MRFCTAVESVESEPCPPFGDRPVQDAFFPLIAFMGLGTVELLVVGGVVLLLFGSRLPKVMRSLGQGIVEFKRGVQGIEDDSHASSGDADRAAGNG